MTSYDYPLTGSIEVSCRLGAGSLTVRADEDRDDARVTVTPRQADSDLLSRSTIELRGRQLIVHVPDTQASPGTRRSRDSVDVEIDLPAGTELKAVVGSADIDVQGRIGSLDIGSGSARISLDQVDGGLQVRGGSGELRVARITGPATVKGGAGRIRIGRADADLTVVVGSGDLELGAAHGQVTMRSGSGGAVIDAAERDLNLTSGSGAFTVGLLPGQQAELDIKTGSGRVRTEMPLESSSPVASSPILIRARTGSGDVTIRRAMAQ